jgi:hypothetical protein
MVGEICARAMVNAFLQDVDGQPLRRVGGSALVGLRQNYSAAMPFPAEKQAGNRHDKKEGEQNGACGAVNLPGQPQQIGLPFSF